MDGHDETTQDSAPIVQCLAVAKSSPKKVSFEPNLNTQDVPDEDQAPRPNRRSRKPKQNFLDFISGIPPDPPKVLHRVRRAATPLLPGSRSSSTAAITESRSSTIVSIAKSASLAAQGISVIDFAYACRNTAPGEGLHQASGDNSPIKDTAEPLAPTQTLTSMYDLGKTEMVTPGLASPTHPQADSPGSVPVINSASNHCNSAPPEELNKSIRDKSPNAETKELPEPDKRVAHLRGSAKSTGVRKKAAKAKRSPAVIPRSRYNLRSGRKIVGNNEQAEVKFENDH